MIWFCADDYGLDARVSGRIQQCIDCGALNKVSVFPNLDPVDLRVIRGDREVRISLHLNLVEGKCMADPAHIPLLVGEDGGFRHTFGGLLKESLLNRADFEEQVSREIRAQVLWFKQALPEGVPFCIDGHQHTHMIPAVFRALLRVLREEQVEVAYMRIPAEPILPYLTTPSLWLTYRPVNLIKQWLLKGLWQINKRQLRGSSVPTADFMGILFSGHMDEARVRKLLPKYARRAANRGRDLEVLFHPGYLKPEEDVPAEKHIVFQTFYRSADRNVEFDSVMKLRERSVL